MPNVTTKITHFSKSENSRIFGDSATHLEVIEFSTGYPAIQLTQANSTDAIVLSFADIAEIAEAAQFMRAQLKLNGYDV